MTYEQLKKEPMFMYFDSISKIPHGSQNMKQITQYCLDFAQKHGLKAYSDQAGNVIIYKDGNGHCNDSAPIILQGHLDMVCQKTKEKEIDFEKDGLEVALDGDFLKANGTTLGADNGIAVAMIMSILADKALLHPPIEAVFTTDEEIGMIGAGKLDFSKLSAKRMINIDAEEQDMLTVSCAGGSDFRFLIDAKREIVRKHLITVEISGLKGGHSGVEIDKGRENAAVMCARIVDTLRRKVQDISLVSVSSGEKANAIPSASKIVLACDDVNKTAEELDKILGSIKTEISDREPEFEFCICKGAVGKYCALTNESMHKLLCVLLSTPNGVVQMSASIDGLVETSLNLGILKTTDEKISLHYALRSNKMSALYYLEQKLCSIAEFSGVEYECFGHYPAWEFKENSPLQKTYIETFKEKFSYHPKVVAIHAGLECGMFASHIKDLDCIAIGPWMYDVHTPSERLDVNSARQMYDLLVSLLEKM